MINVFTYRVIIVALSFNLILSVISAESARSDANYLAKIRSIAKQKISEIYGDTAIKYREGERLVQDDVETAEWFKKAVDLGHLLAQHQLGFIYSTGIEVAQNCNEIFKWYQKSAQQGFNLVQ